MDSSGYTTLTRQAGLMREMQLVANNIANASTPGFVPQDLRSWMLLTIGFLYAQREAIDATGRMVELPARFYDGLLDAHRVYGL